MAAPGGADAQRSSQQVPQLENVFQKSPGPMIITDREGHIRTMNEAARSLLGEPSKETTLQEWPRVFGLYASDGKAPFHPDNLPPIRALRELREVHVEDMLLRS